MLYILLNSGSPMLSKCQGWLAWSARFKDLPLMQQAASTCVP